MCVAIPSRLVDVQGAMGTVDVGGARRRVSLLLLPEAQEGDYVIVHAGFALQRIDEKEAGETLRMLAQIAGGGEPGDAGGQA